MPNLLDDLVDLGIKQARIDAIEIITRIVLIVRPSYATVIHCEICCEFVQFWRLIFEKIASLQETFQVVVVLKQPGFASPKLPMKQPECPDQYE